MHSWKFVAQCSGVAAISHLIRGGIDLPYSIWAVAQGSLPSKPTLSGSYPGPVDLRAITKESSILVSEG
jgi:hypothetical protein